MSMSQPVLKLHDMTLYTDEKLTNMFHDTSCKFWSCPIIERDLGRGLIPTWPDKFTFWSRFKSLFGIYKKTGILGFYTRKLNRIFIMLAYYMAGFTTRISPWVISVTAHEYQHAAIGTNDSATRLALPYILSWYKVYFDELNLNTPSNIRWLETRLVPELLKLEKKPSGVTVREVLQLWKAIRGGSPLRTIIKIITGKEVANDEYFKYIWSPMKTAYLRTIEKRTPFITKLDWIQYYQELFFPSEVQAVRAGVLPQDTQVVRIAKLARLTNKYIT